MTDNTESKNSSQRYGVFLIGVAHVLLILSLLALRSNRIVGSQTPYITLEFIGLLAGAVALIALTTWSVRSGRLQHMLAAMNGWVVAVGIVLSFALLLVIPALLTFLQPYVLPFALWLIFFNLGIIALFFPARTIESPVTLSPDQGKKWLKTAVLILFSLLLPLLVLEIGLRVWYTFFVSETEKAIYTYSAEEIAAMGRYEGSPYINYGLSTTFPEHNSLGYRGPEIDVPKPDGVFRIVALGGSTTYGVGLQPQDTYPAQLQRILREEYGYTQVEVVNAGVAAYTSWDSLANFEFHVLDIDPDMIIVYHAINDVLARLVDPHYYNGLNPVKGIWRTELPALSPSVLVRFVQYNIAGQPNPGQLNSRLLIQSDIQRCNAPDFCPNLQMSPEDVLAANPPIYFERNLRNLAVLAQTNDVDVMFSSWAYFPEQVSDDPMMTYPYIQAAVAEHNAILERLAETLQIPFYDLEARMPYDITYWLDGVHVNAAGAHEQAAEYAAFLVENGLIPAPEEN